jgi:hypothetical protein
MSAADKDANEVIACSNCGELMWWIDTVYTENGPIPIWRCRNCNRLYWRKPKKEGPAEVEGR